MVSTADRQHDVNTRTTTHELSFRRDTFDRRESLDPPTRKITPQQRQLREANVKYQNGLLLEEVKPADNVTAEPIASDNGRNSRARIYDRMSKGALKAHIIDYGTKDQPYQAATINSHRGSNNRWTNILDQKVTWDPKELKGDLTKLAAGTIVRRLAGHPLAQAALVANDAVKVATGKSATEHVGEGYRNTTAAAIQERLKKGQRFTTPYSLPPF
jgi:hypothetical protein